MKKMCLSTSVVQKFLTRPKTSKSGHGYSFQLLKRLAEDLDDIRVRGRRSRLPATLRGDEGYTPSKNAISDESSLICVKPYGDVRRSRKLVGGNAHHALR